MQRRSSELRCVTSLMATVRWSSRREACASMPTRVRRFVTSAQAPCGQSAKLSLRRLGKERIDLYQLHWPLADAAVVLRAWETLCELRREGKIRWAGVSNFDVEQLERCSAVAPIDSAQLPLSLLRRDAGSDLLPWLAARGIPALTYSPLESGILSGRFSLERLASLPASDWRGRREQFQLPQLTRALELVARLGPVALELDVSVAGSPLPGRSAGLGQRCHRWRETSATGRRMDPCRRSRA